MLSVYQQTLLSLGDLIEESMVFLRSEVQLRGISFRSTWHRNLLKVVGDRTQRQQVIVSLAINAVAMAQSGSRKILIRSMLSDPDMVCYAIEIVDPELI